MVVRSSPLAEKLSMGLLIVHSSHMWFRTFVLERRKKLEILSRSQRVIWVSRPPYLCTVSKFSHMGWMWIGQPPGEYLYQRGCSCDHQTKRCYWNQIPRLGEATHVSVFSLCVVQRLTPPLFFFFFSFPCSFRSEMRGKRRGKRSWCRFFKVLLKKKAKKNFKATA